MQEAVLELLAVRRGHFRFESGHHGTLWLDLELLCLQPRRLRPLAAALAARIARHGAELVCGPLIEGAFVAQLVAEELGLGFTYAQPVLRPGAAGLFPVDYVVPPAQRPVLRGRSVAIVNDVINAGSAVRGTLSDLRLCGARPVVVGALLVRGDAAAAFAREQGVELETLAAAPSDLWLPEGCPLCAAGVPLDISSSG